MRCEEIEAYFADHLASAPGAELSREIADHVRTCTACAAHLDGLDETWQMLATLPAARADSDAMRARFDAALEGFQQGSNIDARFGHQSRMRRFAPALAAAAALLLGLGVGRQMAETSPDPQLAGLRDELRDMRQMVTLSLLQQQSASERLKGISFTTQIEQPNNEITLALLDALMHDPNVNVRLATIDALKPFAARELVRRGVIEAMPQQTSPLVQIALIDFVVETNDSGATSTLRRLAGDLMVDEAVRARATSGLKQIG